MDFEGWEDGGVRCLELRGLLRYFALTLTLSRRAGEGIGVVGGSIASIKSVIGGGLFVAVVTRRPELNHR